MKLEIAARQLESLGSPVRLKIYRALVRAGAEGLSCGSLQAKVGIAAAGRPADVAAQISRYIAAGARDIGIDMVSRRGEREEQFEQFAREVIPLLR